MATKVILNIYTIIYRDTGKAKTTSANGDVSPH